MGMRVLRYSFIRLFGYSVIRYSGIQACRHAAVRGGAHLAGDPKHIIHEVDSRWLAPFRLYHQPPPGPPPCTWILHAQV